MLRVFLMGLWESVAAMPGEIANALLGVFKGILVAFLQPLLEAVKVMVTANINPYDFQNLWQVVVSVISLFYVLIFILVGLKFLLGSYDAIQRAEAKEWFKDAIVLVIAVNASLLIYSLLLNISSAVSLTLWNSDLEKIFDVQNLDALNIIWIGMFAFSALLASFSLVIRQVFLIVGVMLFPAGIALYLVRPLRFYGSFILNFIMLAVFMQVVDVIILIALNLVSAQFSSVQSIGLLSMSVGLLLIAVVNVIAFFLSLLNAVLSALKQNPAVGMVAKAVVGVL